MFSKIRLGLQGGVRPEAPAPASSFPEDVVETLLIDLDLDSPADAFEALRRLVGMPAPGEGERPHPMIIA